jgi:hypothetical protein
MKKICLVIMAALLVLGSQAYATVNFDPGTTHSTTALTGFQTLGDLMVGMSVTAFFSNQTSQNAIWAATGSGAGAAGGTGWSLSMTGDTFSDSWTLSNSSGNAISRILIDGQPGDTIFDITDPDPGTPGSARGNTFNPDAGLVVTYRDLVALTGFAPVGDLYLRLDIQFPNGFASGAAAPNTFKFVADTDNAGTPGDIHPTPEPATMLLLGFGLLGLVGARKKFQK